MPKKPTSKRLDKLFENIPSEAANPRAPVQKKKQPPRPVDRKTPISAAHVVPTRPIPRAAPAEEQSRPNPLPPIETVALSQRGENDAPSSMSLAFQMDSRNWATLQVVDDKAARDWDPNEQLLVKQVADQLTQALENARLFQETRQRADELAALNDLARRLTSQFNFNEIINTIYEGLSALLNARNFYVAIYEPRTNEVLFPRNISESSVDTAITRLPMGKGITAHIISSRESVLINDGTDQWMARHGLEATGEPAKSFMGVPLISGQEALGAIAVQDYAQYNAYPLHSLQLLTAFANQAAIAIQNSRLFEETQRRSRELSILNELNQRLSARLDIEQVLQEIYRGVTRLVDAKNFYIGLYSPENNEISFPLNVSESVIDLKITTIPADAGLTGRLLQTRKPLLIPDNLAETLQSMGIAVVGEIAKCWMGAPLLLGDQVIGVLAAQSYAESNAYDQHDLDLLTAISSQAAIAIQNARLFEAMQRSEADLRALFASMQDVVLVIDSDTRYVRIAPTNPSRLFRPPEELLGKRMDEILPPETHIPFREAIQKALQSKEAIQIEYQLPVENQLYWFLASVSRLNDREVFWVARDITARKQDEEALQRRNEYLSATAEISQLVTSTLDMPTLFSRTVKLVRERFGFYHAGIFVTEEAGFRSVLQAATGEAGAEMLRQKHSLIVGSKSVVGGVTESGRAVVVNDTLASEIHKFNPLLPETRAEAALPLRVGGRVIGALDIQSTNPNAFTENDIAVLQTLADQIAIAIDNARSYELSLQAIKEMREADKLKSQFLANMSHELRTPLNSIIGFSRVIIKGIDGPTTDLQQQDLLAIHNSGQHLLGLINDILDLSRIEAGKMELTFDEVNLNDLISSVLSTVVGLVKDKPITLERDLPADLPTVRADAMRIRQVLLNLLSNAAKFTDEGAITVTAAQQTGPSGRPEVVIRVTDTGPGVSKEDQKKLFQPFSQVDSSPTRKSGGSGLGLSISSHLVQMHGGLVGVESEVGKGSVFYFTLPTFHGQPEESQQGSRVILAIDDDPQVIKLYERYLQPQGYQVVALTDPTRAVERARELKPFAITLDIMMPGYDGWSALNDLKTNAATHEVPVVVCSIIEEKEKGFSLGAADYLVKPILEEDLLSALDRLNADSSIHEILVVDDDPNELRLIEKMLSSHPGYRSTLMEGGQNGWQAIQTRAPHAVILDLFMPDMDGFAILERMRASDKLRDIPVIFVSGAELTVEQQNQLHEFGQRLIQKSALDEKQLIHTLERALQRVRK